MAKIESVLERQRGAYEFDAYYKNLCALQNSCPLPQVCAHLHDKVLDINGDRVRVADWIPIIGTININKTLEFIAIRSYFQNTIDDQEKRGYNVKRKIPAIRSREITSKLCNSLKSSLCVSPSLRCLELQGLPLRTKDVTLLAKGIRANGSLQHLSFEYSRIGDEGLEILCAGIKNAPSVSSLNFTGCSLTWQGAEHLSQLIQHQAMQRHNEAWQDSLRYRRPDLDRMAGIRRITLNRNALIKDEGARVLAEALKDDLWLKALDLQYCGLTDTGAKHLVDVLKYNTCIVVLDVRNNPMVGQALNKTILEHLMINNNGQETEFKWLASEPLQDPGKVRSGGSGSGRKKRTKTLQNSFGRKTIIKVAMPSRRRSRSVGSPAPGQQHTPDSATTGIPWRAAMRANRCRGYPPEHSPGRPSLFSHMEGGTPVVETDGDETTVKIEYKPSRSPGTTCAELGSEEDESELTTSRGVRVEIEQLRRRLKEETKARSKAEARVIELTVENSQLRQEVGDFRQKQGVLDDEQVLASIETSFKQFHSFLDLLKQAGLGQLISLAGIDQSAMTLNHIPRNGNGKLEINSNGVGAASALNLNESPSSRVAPGNKNGVQCRSDPALTKEQATGKPRVAFPQITPQNYQHGSDPTAAAGVSKVGAGNRNGGGKAKEKFDEMLQRALEDSDDALQRSLTEQNVRRLEAGNGLYTQGPPGAGIPLQSPPAHDTHTADPGHISDHSQRSSQHSSRKSAASGGGLANLHDIDDLNDEDSRRAKGQKSRDVSERSAGGRGGAMGSAAQYTDTFERSEDGSVEEDIEEDIDNLSNNSF